MKNIHLLRTDRESNLYKSKNELFTTKEYFTHSLESQRENNFIYITNDEIIREGDWCLNIKNNHYFQATYTDVNNIYAKNLAYKIDGIIKIILTNDSELIKDGVQEISEEFLKQFVISPVDYVEVEEFNAYGVDNWKYTISFPPKNIKTEEKSKLISEFERLEGITSNEFDDKDWARFDRFVEGRKEEVKEEKLYTQSEVLEQLNLLYSMKNSLVDTFTDKNDYITIKWFEQNG